MKSLKFEKNKPVLQTNDELRNMSAIKVPAAKLCSDDKSEKLIWKRIVMKSAPLN